MPIKSILLSFLFSLPVLVLSAQNKRISKNVWQGKASYYHNMFEGRKTANGEIFRQSKLTGANNTLPLGTRVKVTNLKNGRSVVVKINDRMAKRLTHVRLIDLSRTAASRLGFINAGLAQVRMEVLGKSGYKAIAKKKSTKKKKPTVVKKKKVIAKSIPKKKKAVVVKKKPIVVKKKKVVARVQPKKKKTSHAKKKTIAKKKKAIVAKKISVPSKKASRYVTKKKDFLAKRKKKYLFTKMKQSDLNWSKTVAKYTESYKEEESYLEGGPLAFLDGGEIFKSFSKPKANNNYAFVLISNKLQSPEEFKIEPIDSVTHEPIQSKVLLESAPTFSKKGNHFIYYFSYAVPNGTEFLRFTINGVDYADAKSEDFALYIFSE